MTPTVQSSQIRGVAQAGLDNISQSMNQRHAVGAYYTIIHQIHWSSYSNISAMTQQEKAVLNSTFMLIIVA